MLQTHSHSSSQTFEVADLLGIQRGGGRWIRPGRRSSLRQHRPCLDRVGQEDKEVHPAGPQMRCKRLQGRLPPLNTRTHRTRLSLRIINTRPKLLLEPTHRRGLQHLLRRAQRPSLCDLVARACMVRRWKMSYHGMDRLCRMRGG